MKYIQLALWLLLCGYCSAQVDGTLHLTNGSTIQGYIVTKNNDGSVVIKVDGSNKTFFASEITSVDFKTSTDTLTTIKGPKVRYKDGVALLYFVRDGVSVTMRFGTNKDYGNYYIAAIAIENFTGSSFNFHPSQMKAILVRDDISRSLKIYSSDEYLSKIRKKQKTSAFFYAWGQNYAASQAGYSASITNSNSSFVSAGYYGDNYGYAVGQGSSVSRTQTYNSSDQYAAQQNANNNVSNLKAQQYQIRNQMDLGYLKLNTLDNQDRLTGQVNIEFRTGDHVRIIVPVNGLNYEFDWEAVR